MTDRVLRCEDGWNVLAGRPTDPHAKFCGTAFTLGNGYLATRGTCPELGADRQHPAPGAPATFMAGVFEKPLAEEKPPRLAVCPDWLPFRLDDDDGDEEGPGDGGHASDVVLHLNLRAGTFTRSYRWTGARGRVTRLEITRLVSLAAPHLCGERFSITPESYSGPIGFTSILDARGEEGDPPRVLSVKEPVSVAGAASALAVGIQTRSPAGEIVAVSSLRGAPAGAAAFADQPGGGLLRHRLVVSQGVTVNLDRIVAYAGSRDPRRGRAIDRAVAAVRRAPSWERLLADQREAWRRFWRQSGVEIEGDPETQWMLRFCMFHLWQCACENTLHTDASIGARGIHGEGYNGHVFWDTETYMLPFFISSQPEVARALLMYRHRRLPAARRRARLDDGIDGARFPWESAATGEETTPRCSTPDASGRVTPIRTGEQEIHITADVAHAAWSYCEVSGDRDFYRRAGAEIVLDAARFWAGRLERRQGEDGEDRYELTGVIGPDEYHESVPNNLYTNAMARWNLRRAVEIGRDLMLHEPGLWRRLARRLGLTPATLDRWEAVAERIVIPFDDERQLHPQFEGFFELEDALDRCAYREKWRCVDAERLQLVKQPDVLLALHLLPELTDSKSFERHFEYYDARTTHESSISPSMHALFAARASRPALGFDYLKKALALDCVSCDGGSDSGIHAANLGGVWKAVVMGFGGVTSSEEGLALGPCLPRHWTALGFSLRWRSSTVRLQITHGEIIAWLEAGDDPVPLFIDGQQHQLVPGQTYVFPRRAAEQQVEAARSAVV